MVYFPCLISFFAAVSVLVSSLLLSISFISSSDTRVVVVR